MFKVFTKTERQKLVFEQYVPEAIGGDQSYANVEGQGCAAE